MSMTTEEKAKVYAGELRVSTAIPGVVIPMIADMVEAAYLAGATEALASQWVSVEERLPEDATQCLVFLPGSYDDNIVRLAWYDGDKFHDVQTDQRHRPSFWMPIPIPPLKGGDA
ncbi:DUF551 domain-containing protein [uncultured Duncaniella sp.]|uniref:DUF551 domain-containing protein n=1 Tax=uncultured Duncaniella sp. TaxID=2768039 RepID=UPI00272FDBA0|nr:DUF551 domain-containing protein [uncultured Duncaniella sp.]